MKPRRLEIEFLTNKSKYVLLRRSERSAVYKQYIDGILVGYEVYSPIPIRKEETFKGVVFPLREVVPSSESFGTGAWTLGIYYTEEQVIEKFEKLDKELIIRENDRLNNRKLQKGD